MQVWCDWQLTLCDPHLSALEVRFHDDALYKSMFTFTFTFLVLEDPRGQGISLRTTTFDDDNDDDNDNYDD